MEREFNMEIEGLMVKILYEYEEGESGDYWTPPTGPRVTILGWELKDDKCEDYQDLTDEEWNDWMSDINKYVYTDAMWDIIEFEEDLKTDRLLYEN